tara:strand:- start:450 stop:2450 length:2001 start_codon:yes stop_codon:yes gene_type:complete
MAIKGFKDIIDRKGYKVDSDDRKVFEKEISKSNFGLGCSDMIEFILYDSSENQLPQGEDEKLVRYIHINDANIENYFIISDNQFTKKKDGTPEFIVDIEKLIREAGYSNGIFKTQVTLLNRRVGSDAKEGDDMWIHEISPSRTEIRILPNRAKGENKDLEKRLSLFLDNKNFRDDVIYYVNVFIDKLELEKILQYFLFCKGKEQDGINYINLIKEEFQVESFEILLNRIKTKFVKSMEYYAQRRNWHINDINFGKPLGDESDCVELSIEQLERDAQQSLINCIDFFLPKRDIQVDNILSKEEQITFDKVKQILKSTTSSSIYNSTVPDKVNARVRGCTDPKAENYNPLAQDNDGSCKYKVVEEVEEEEPAIKGCTDSTALNYNPNATVNNGTCKYENKIETVTKNYYVWSADANIKYKENGTNKSISGKEFDSFTITHDKGQFKFKGDVRETPKPANVVSTMMYNIKNNNIAPTPQMEFLYPAPDYKQIAEYYGQNQFGSDSYNNNYGLGRKVPNPFYNEVLPVPMSVTYKDAIGNTKTTSMLLPGDSTTICAEKGTVQKMPGIVISELGSCVEVLPPDKKAPIRVKPSPPPPPTKPKPIPIIRGGGPRGGMTSTAALVNDDYSAILIEEGRVSETDVVKNTNISLTGGIGGGDIVLRRPKVRREL